MEIEKKCNEKCEVWARAVGFFTPTFTWNKGKTEEFKNRKMFSLSGIAIDQALETEKDLNLQKEKKEEKDKLDQMHRKINLLEKDIINNEKYIKMLKDNIEKLTRKEKEVSE